MKKIKGKLIIIDGTDGSGKATQTKLLIKRLKKEGYKTAALEFPQYGAKSAGLIENYLAGLYGTADEVGPYRASVFYAVDRYDASQKIRRWLTEGRVVVADRYVTANMGHQGSKIKSAVKRQQFFNWLNNLEFKIFDLPRPNLNIILYVPIDITLKLMTKRGGKPDLHEADVNHLKAAAKTYVEMTKTLPGLKLINCAINKHLLTPEEIHEMIWGVVKSKVLR